jgi:MAF protein
VLRPKKPCSKFNDLASHSLYNLELKKQNSGNTMANLILASTSPFRQALLEKLAIPFDTVSPNVDETPVNNETPAQLVERLAIAKAKAVADTLDDGLVIGSDQVAVTDNKILGKPGDHGNAVQQLKQVSGKKRAFFNRLVFV